MKRAFKILNIIMAVVGYLTALMIFAGFLYLQFGPPLIDFSAEDSTPQNDHLTLSDAQKTVSRFSELQGVTVTKVIASFDSPRSFHGDGATFYKFEVEGFPLDDLIANRDWIEMPTDEDLYLRAIESIRGHAGMDGIEWVPDAERLNSEDFIVNFDMIRAYGRSVHDVVMLAYDRKNKFLYYLNGNI